MPLGDYPYIRRYGKHCKQAAHYISAQVQRARLDGAPQDAVHWFDGRWFTAADIRNVDTRRALGLPPLDSHDREREEKE